MHDLETARRAAMVTCLTTGDTDLAAAVRDAMRALAGQREAYVRLFASCPGVRVAGDFNAGLVASATVAGRGAMEDAYVRIRCAAVLPAGLDGNTVVDRVTGRRNPRLDHLPRTDQEETADREDREQLDDAPWSPRNVAAALAATRRTLDPLAYTA